MQKEKFTPYERWLIMFKDKKFKRLFKQKNFRTGFYITTAIDYVNAPPHIGHALEKVQADAIARYQKLLGKEVYFLTGADEHGAKVVRAAGAAGVEVQKFVDKNTGKFQELASVLGISNDDFIRTSGKERHYPAAQKLWKKLDESGDIYKKKYQGLYCVGHEAFVTEKDLMDGKCADHGKEPEVIKEENYFFKLSKYTDKIRKVIESDEIKIYPASRKNEVLSLIKDGAEDVSFSRPAKDISWGIPVPDDESQTMYVWCDALTNYISALGYAEDGEKFDKFWPADLHVIGKDILRFHALIWPGVLMSAGLPLPKAILAHGFITVEGKKMSKTLGNVVNPFELIEKYGKEAVRYYFLREISTFEDGDFSENKFIETYNANLANGLGNYVSRVAKMIQEYFDGEIEKQEDKELSVDKMIAAAWKQYNSHMQNYELQKATDVIWDLISKLDGYVQEHEPFKLIKKDKKKTKIVLWNLALGALNVGSMLKPFMPETAENIFKIFGADSHEWDNVKINKFDALFPRI